MQCMDFSLEELFLLNILSTKSLLISLKFDNSSDNINDFCNTLDIYKEFVYSIYYLLEVEPCFFILDDSFIDNTFRLLETHRFDKEFINNVNLFEKENYIIRDLNFLKNLSGKQKFKQISKYINEQFSNRSSSFKSLEGLLISQSYDYSVINQLFYEKSILPLDDLTLISINYLLNKYPFLFSNKIIRNNTNDLLEKISIENKFKNRVKNKKLKKIKEIINDFGE